MKPMTIEIPEGKKAEWVDGVLTLVDEQPKDITERIKTFEDACEWCKENGKQGLYEQYADAINVGLQRAKDILAYLKLRIITCALNEGWETDYDKRSIYYPYLELQNAQLKVSYSYSSVISPLMFKSEVLALYAATQFKDIYMDFCKGKV